MSGGNTPTALTDAATALQTLAAESCLGLDTETLTQRSCELQRLTNQLDAIRTTTIRQTEQAHITTQTGTRASTEIAGQTHVDVASIREDQRIGQWLDHYSSFTNAHLDGVLSRDHLKLLRKADNLRNRHQLQQDQEFFIDKARELDFKDFQHVVTYWLNASDPDGELPKEQQNRAGLTCHTNADGTLTAKLRLDPLSAAAFTKAVGTETQRLFRTDAENDVVSNNYSRQGRALMNLITRGTQNNDGTYPTPITDIVVGEELAEQILNDLAGNDTPEDKRVTPDFDDINRRCEFSDGTPLHPQWAALILASGVFRRVVMDTKSRPIDVSVKSRGFPPWMKHLLLLRARGRCTRMGCDAPLSWLQADHVTPHVKNGPTTLANGQILCDPHNKLKRDNDPN